MTRLTIAVLFAALASVAGADEPAPAPTATPKPPELVACEQQVERLARTARSEAFRALGLTDELLTCRDQQQQRAQQQQQQRAQQQQQQRAQQP